MSKHLLLSGWLLVASASPLAGQGNSQCTSFNGNSQSFNVCNAAVDGTVIFHPVAGLLVSGGNPVIGTASTLGGFFHLSLTARVNATKLKTPNLNYDGTTTTVGQDQEIFAPAPLVEAAVGIFKGIGSGFLALDALGSAQLLPTTQIHNLTVDPNARKIGSVALGLGYGAKVGVFGGRGPIPAISVSVMRRDIPKLTYGNVPSGDQYSYGIDLHATNLRAMAGYKLAILNVSAGLGWDKYTGTADVVFRDPTDLNPLTNVHTLTPIDLNQSRSMVFADAALDLSVIKLAAEAGYQLGKSQTLATTFTGNNPGDSRLFVGAGIRISF